VRALSPLASLLLVAGVCLVAASPPATATSTLLCRGYDGCTAAGMSASGYKAASSTMWWRMYAGHNCTNYVAYRLVKSGLSTERPWSGSGNASNWGPANPSLTDSAPTVGSVAWWGANVRPAGSSGHVAYVEQVISADEIIVSQDSWGGDFSWARITRVGGSWPSGFIHFNDRPMNNVSVPTLSGTAKVGALLTASPGTWSQPEVTLTYQWRAGRTNVAGATAPTFKPRLAQQDMRISVRVTAAKFGYPSTAVTSLKTLPVAPGEISISSRPSVTGDPRVDSVLTASPGTWSPTPSAVSYQWFGDGKPVEGATGATFAPGPQQVGKRLAIQVTAAKDGYAAVSSTSVATGPVVAGTLTLTAPPVVSGTPRPGETLSLDPGAFTPEASGVSVEWLRGRAVVEGANASTYQLTSADLGSRIIARLTVTRPGYTTLVPEATSKRLVREIPKLRVRTPGRGEGRVRVSVEVSAPGVQDVPGTVAVIWRGTTLKQLTLERGAASTTLKGLPSGDRTLRLRYLGSRSVLTAKVLRPVRIG